MMETIARAAVLNGHHQRYSLVVDGILQLVCRFFLGKLNAEDLFDRIKCRWYAKATKSSVLFVAVFVE